MMFKFSVIQATNNLADERAEFLINDRLSSCGSWDWGFPTVSQMPARSGYSEKLTKAGAIKTLFERFDATLRQAGFIAMSGQIVDASLIAAPRQRNNDTRRRPSRKAASRRIEDKPAKLRQKDRDARWTVKFTKAKPREDGSTPPVDLAISLFGYQNHISIDRGFASSVDTATDAAPTGRRCAKACSQANTAADLPIPPTIAPTRRSCQNGFSATSIAKPTVPSNTRANNAKSNPLAFSTCRQQRADDCSPTIHPPHQSLQPLYTSNPHLLPPSHTQTHTIHTPQSANFTLIP